MISSCQALRHCAERSIFRIGKETVETSQGKSQDDKRDG